MLKCTFKSGYLLEQLSAIKQEPLKDQTSCKSNSENLTPWKPTNVKAKVNPVGTDAKLGKIKDTAGDAKGKSRIECSLTNQPRVIMKVYTVSCYSNCGTYFAAYLRSLTIIAESPKQAKEFAKQWRIDGGEEFIYPESRWHVREISDNLSAGVIDFCIDSDY